MSELLSGDAAARELALTEFCKPLVLIAGAGTGKTTTLIRRVLVWSLGQGWERHAAGDDDAVAARVLERITCLTFTVKAASEMSARFIADVQKIAQNAKGLDWLTPHVDIALVRARAPALARQAHLLQASTIHAWCQRVLRAHAVTAGVHPGFELDAEGVRTNELVMRIAQDARPQLMAAGSPAQVFWENGFSPWDVDGALQALVTESVPPSALAEMICGGEAASEFICDTAALAEEVASLMPSPNGTYKRSGHVRDAAEKFRALAAMPIDRAFNNCVRAELKDRAEKYFKKLSAKRELEHLTEAAREHCDQLLLELTKRSKALATFDPALLSTARDVLTPMLEQVQARMRAEGCLRQDDLLTLTARMLRRNPAVAASIASDTDQFLLDEVQDTDPCQYEIVKLLAVDAPMRPGLFVIGDPKQCIYTFRNADLGALEEFLASLKTLDVQVRNLVVNYRSERPVLDAVTRLMQPNMREVRGSQPAFQLLEPYKQTQACFAGAAAVELWDSSTSEDEKSKAKDARELEAEAIAHDIVQRVAAGASPREFMILLRVATDQHFYLRALRKRRVAVVAENERDWHQRREIIDLISALLCVLDPEDKVALLGYLRSPHVGLPDAALAKVWKAVSSDLNFVAEEAVSLKHALASIQSLRAAFAEKPVDEFYCEFRRVMHCEETESVRFLGDLRLAAMEELLTSVQAMLLEGVAPLLCAARLREQLAGETKRDNTMPADAQVDAVRVMTVHKAKGLEAKHVYLADMARKKTHGQRKQPSAVAKRWRNFDASEGAALAPRRWALSLLRASDLQMAQAEEQAHDRETHELVRLLYVAATRAEERLVLVADWSTAFNKDEEPAELTGSLLGLLRNADGVDALAARAALAASIAQGSAHVDHGGWHWVSLAEVMRRAVVQPARDIVEEGCAPLRVALPLGQSTDALWQRPLSQPISKMGHASAVHVNLCDDPEERPTLWGLATSNANARIRGTQVHRALELWRTSEDPAAEVERVLGLVAREGSVDPEAERILRAFPQSELCKHLCAIMPRIKARECPLLDRGVESAVLAVVGTVDMIYEDREGGLVVVDYKTDKVNEAGLLRQHGVQLLTYCAALREVFTGRTVRAEMWSIHLDRVVSV